jgi:deoxynucleoside triphosphate triphosphohydrolase SAMHD1
MITDALLAADKHMKISESIFDPARYSLLTDCIVKEIERSSDKELKKSRDILHRIRKRDLYKFVDEFNLPGELLNQKEFSVESILENQEGDNLTIDDLILDDHKFNYAMKDKNPVDSVYFYNKGSEEKFHISRKEISLLIPDQFQERYIGCYVKDASKLEDARTAFKNWTKKLHVKSSPYKKH